MGQTVEPSASEDVLVVGKHENGAIQLWYWCPGCKSHHALPQKGTPQLAGWPEGVSWEWNGDKVKPSLVPSVLSQGERVCHHYVTAGKIWFLPDSTHELSGQTVELEHPPVADA